jgi:RNA polymerase sigma-70 factor (ECF subfamily)
MKLPQPFPASRNDLRRLRHRQPAAVSRWFETYADALYSFVYYRVGKDPELAADVTQDTFVAALERIESYDPDRGEMLPWLTYTARNCIRKERRRQASGADANQLWLRIDAGMAAALADLDRAPLPSEVLEREETAELVRTVLSNLPFRYQRALLDRYFQHRSVVEIAAREGCSEGAAKSLLHRARRAFRAAFEAAVGTLLQSTTTGRA